MLCSEKRNLPSSGCKRLLKSTKGGCPKSKSSQAWLHSARTHVTSNWPGKLAWRNEGHDAAWSLRFWKFLRQVGRGAETLHLFMNWMTSGYAGDGPSNKWSSWFLRYLLQKERM